MDTEIQWAEKVFKFRFYLDSVLISLFLYLLYNAKKETFYSVHYD